MASFKAIWADDAWAEGGDPQESAYLASCLQAITGALDDAGCRVDWKCYGLASGAAVEVASRGTDVHLALLDFRFGSEQWDWRTVLDALARRNIPYIVFTNFPKEPELIPRLQEDPLRLATLGKDRAGVDELVARVVAFFRAPPIRILHLSDLHVWAEPGSGDHGEQEARFAALYECLEEESATRPFDVVAFTGDFAGHNPPLDLVAAREKVRVLMDKAVLGEAERAFIIPGNHDVHWADFAAGVLARNPWQPYLDFYHACFGGRQKLLAELAAWNPELRFMRPEAAAGALMWHRRPSGTTLSVLGFATPSVDPAAQGQGEFTAAHAEFVKKHWRGEPAPGEVRLALMHHNLFSVLSASAQDEQHTMAGSGAALKALLSAHCHLVLSGHTHAPVVMQCSAARLGTAAWSAQGTLTAVSAGTTGGVHPGLDRARAFNILEVGDGREGEARSLTVRTFLFDGGDRSWVEAKPFSGLALHG